MLEWPGSTHRKRSTRSNPVVRTALFSGSMAIAAIDRVLLVFSLCPAVAEVGGHDRCPQWRVMAAVDRQRSPALRQVRTRCRVGLWGPSGADRGGDYRSCGDDFVGRRSGSACSGQGSVVGGPRWFYEQSFLRHDRLEERHRHESISRQKDRRRQGRRSALSYGGQPAQKISPDGARCPVGVHRRRCRGERGRACKAV